ncbi:MAG TPA: PepSY-like domain-containing protein [Tepidisphaeraceae bacterium]|nr:PepSY-like domain-containing protein [Tepidisphaeraceae bacterium]
MKRNFILASVVSVTLMGVAPTMFAADRNNNAGAQLRDENRIDYSQVPGDVKRAIEPQLNSGDKVTDVYKFKRGDRTIYVAYTNDERIIRADDKGNLLSVKSTDDENEPARVPVKYNNLPGEVKDTLGKEAKGHPMEIWKVTRDGKTFYVANIDDNEGTHRIRVNSNGDIMERPVLLSERGDTRDRDRNDRLDRSRDDRDDIDARRRADRSRYNSEGEKLSFENLPGDVKQTVGAEMGQDKVTDVLRLKRNGKTVYRVEIEGADRARTIWVDENGKMIRELNDTEEGRVRVNFNELPGNVKSAMINEAHNQEPKRVWQVTRGRDTWYIGEANDGHLVRIDSDGKVMSHDSNPKLLSDRDRDNNRDRDRDNNARNDNNKFERARDIDLSNAEKMRFGDVPDSVKQTIRDETHRGEKLSAIYKVKGDNGSIQYIVKTDDGRTIRVGEHGALLGQTR